MVNLCNNVGWSGSISYSAGYLRISPIDVSSLPSPFTPTHLGYTAGSTMNGNIALGLYTDDSGSPDELICQTASTAITSNDPNPVYLITTSDPVEHSDTLWIGFITNGVTVSDLKGVEPIDPTESKYMTHAPYPTFPATFVSTGDTGTNWAFCMSTTGSAGTRLPPPPIILSGL